MRYHITRLFGLGGTGEYAQQEIAKSACDIGFNELGLYHYPVRVDSTSELRKRIDGIVAGVQRNDVVILQLPTWNDVEYEKEFIRKMKRYKVRLGILVHDVRPMMFNKGEDSIREIVDVYNMADLLILPSKAMHDFLIERGLNVKKVLYQSIMDLNIDFRFPEPVFSKRIFFVGDSNRFPELLDWKGESEIYWYTRKLETNNSKLIHGGFLSETEFLVSLAKGGVGLVWADGQQGEYYKYNQPHKLCSYLAAGIPVIVKRGTAHSEFVLKYNLGVAVDTLKEADEFVQNLSEETYLQYLNNIKDISNMIRNGMFSKKLLIDAVHELLLP